MTPERHDQRPAGVGLELAVVLVVLVAANLLAWQFVARERTLYAADRLTYWVFSSRLARLLTDHPLQAISSVAESVLTRDVSLLPAAPVALAMTLVGSSRLAYLLSVVNLYGLAALLALVFASRQVAHRAGNTLEVTRPVAATALLATLLLFSTLWRPVLIGYLDVGGVAIALVVLALYLPTMPGRLSARTAALVGALVALLFLFRRWYAFWSVSFCLVVAADALAEAVHRRVRDLAGLWSTFRPVLCLGGAAVATLALLAAPMVVHVLGTDYSDAHTAYRTSWVGSLWSIVTNFGLVVPAALAGSAVVLGLRRETRRLSLLLSTQVVLTFVLMRTVQDHTDQHWYLYFPNAMLLVVLALRRTFALLPRPMARAGFVGATLLVGWVVTASVFSARATAWAEPFWPLLARNRALPEQRQDLAEVRRLLGRLDQLTEATNGYVYVLASSGLLSDQALAYANISLDTSFRCPPRILSSAHVDRRDGFPAMLLEASVVVLATPVQYHLRQTEQQVVGIPADCFAEGTAIAAAYRLLPEVFVLEHGVAVQLYERMRPIRAAEVEELAARLRDAYPDRPLIYSPRLEGRDS